MVSDLDAFVSLCDAYLMDDHDPSDASPTRRRVLLLGAATATTVLSVRPALAQTAASVLACEIPVPGPADSGRAVAQDGTLVSAGTAGSYPGGRVFRGEEVRQALRGGGLPGTSYGQGQAYLAYIRRLQYGRAGYTCYCSLQRPR